MSLFPKKKKVEYPFKRNTFPIMNYDTDWFVGPLGQVAFFPPNGFLIGLKPPCSGDLGLINLVRIRTWLPCSYTVYALTNQTTCMLTWQQY